MRGFSRVGDVRGSYGSTITVATHEYRNAATGASQHGISVVEGACPLMFLRGAGFPHSLHGSLLKLCHRHPEQRPV